MGPFNAATNDTMTALLVSDDTGNLGQLLDWAPQHGGVQLPQLARIAILNGVRDVWVTGQLPALWWQAAHPPHGFLALGTGEDRKEYPTKVAARWTDETGVVFIHHIDDNRWGLPGYVASKLRALESLSVALDRPLGFSPAWLGMGLLKATVNRHSEWFNVVEPPIKTRIERPSLDYCRRLAVYDGDWLHAFDVRNAYLATATSLTVGYGEPKWYRADDVPAPNTIARSGVVRLEQIVDHPQVRAIPRNGYYDVAAYRIAAYPKEGDMGAMGAYLYGESCRPFRAWGERLREVKGQMSTVEGAALVKSIYTQAIGSLNPTKPKSNMWYHKPYWHAALESEQARRRWKTFYECRGVALDVDTIVFVSHSDDPASVAVRTEPDRLGSYRYLWSAPNSTLLQRASALGAGGRFVTMAAASATKKAGDF